MYDILVYLFENCQQTEVAYESERVAKKRFVLRVAREGVPGLLAGRPHGGVR